MQFHFEKTSNVKPINGGYFCAMGEPYSINSLLAGINGPADIKQLSIARLKTLCEEIRQLMIEVVSVKGGHLAAGLGVVELTVAIHYVFDTPFDSVIWDVGHQAYAHKIITGRKNEFANQRTLQGISGFPKISESIFDSFGVGHASTSISAALGMAVADQLKGKHSLQHIAIIGDGALTGGLAFEGLNNAGVSNANLLIVLNDNDISIDHAVGALSHQLDDAHTEQKQKPTGFADGRSRRVLLNSHGNSNNALKAISLSPAAFFESLNIHYQGPIDGHNLELLIKELEHNKTLKGPRLLHIKTTKGKGFQPAENDQVTWHAPGKFDKLTGEILKNPNAIPEPPKFQDVFGNTLVELAKMNPNIVGITPAMPSGSSMNIFMKAFPERAFDVGIAEEHAVTFSAGLATKGLIPYCNIYSTFLQRAYDQVIHDVCLQNLPVVFCIDRAGLVGEDGATHHGVFDMAFLRIIPNLMVAAPMNEEELRNLMFTAQTGIKGPIAIRYPRGRGTMVNWKKSFKHVAVGKGECIYKGSKVAILTIGTIGNIANQAIGLMTGKKPSLYNMRFVKPMDTELIKEISTKYERIITLEDGCISGGFGSAVSEYLDQIGATIPRKHLGIPDHFVGHGKVDELHEQLGLDKMSLLKHFEKYMQ